MQAKAYGPLSWSEGNDWRPMGVRRANGGTWQFRVLLNAQAKRVTVGLMVIVDDPSTIVRMMEWPRAPRDVLDAVIEWEHKAMLSLAHHAVTGEYFAWHPEESAVAA